MSDVLYKVESQSKQQGKRHLYILLGLVFSYVAVAAITSSSYMWWGLLVVLLIASALLNLFIVPAIKRNRTVSLEVNTERVFYRCNGEGFEVRLDALDTLLKERLRKPANRITYYLVTTDEKRLLIPRGDGINPSKVFRAIKKLRPTLPKQYEVRSH